MQLAIHHALLPLSDRAPQRWARAVGLRLRARRGSVWITVDHELRDIVLQPGEQWTVDSEQPVTVSALGSSALLELVDPAASRSSSWPQRLRALAGAAPAAMPAGIELHHPLGRGP